MVPSRLGTEAVRNVLCQVYRKYYVVAIFHNYNFLLYAKKHHRTYVAINTVVPIIAHVKLLM